MKLSLVDYMTMLQELMSVVGFTQEQTTTYVTQLQQGRITLDYLSANVAIQCFIRGHGSANADIVRIYLREHQENQKVKFSDDT